MNKASNLMPAKIIMSFPKWMSTDIKDPRKTPIVAKYFNPSGIGTWYAVEYDMEDTLYGLAVLHEPELGYFSLSELQKIKLPFGVTIERDLYYRGTLYDAMQYEKYPHIDAHCKKGINQ